MVHKSIILPRLRPYFQSSRPKSACSLSFPPLLGAAAVVDVVGAGVVVAVVSMVAEC